MNILGINAYHANASAALVCDGKLVAAVEEERLNRVKYAAGFPVKAIRYCLKAAGITLDQVDHLAIPRDPWARMGTKLFYALRMPQFALERRRAWASFADVPTTLAQSFGNRSQAYSRPLPSRGAPPRAPRQRILCIAVRSSRSAFRRWTGRFRQHHVGGGRGRPHAHSRRHRLPSFFGHVLHGAHAISRLLEVRR